MTAKRLVPLPLLIAAALHSAQAGTILEITEDALGHPVPEVVESLTPIEGFRSYGSLQARFLDLAMSHDHISLHNVGSSIEGRTITAFRFGREAAMPKGAAVLQGSLHPREWTSPEAVAAIFEWLALEAESDPVADYLLDKLDIVISPLANPDGLLQTQRHYNKTLRGFRLDGYDGRDGRMRRKNMRGEDEEPVDEALNTNDDLYGVDLNRNHPYGYGSGSSDSPTSTIYRGGHHGSEPETQAFYSALQLIDTGRLRMGIDFHSHQQVYYVITDGNEERDAATQTAFNIMSEAIQETTGVAYSPMVTPMEQAIGATDEYVTGAHGAMGYTCEARPSTWVLPNGFILPDSQVSEMRSELLAATRAGLYYAAGPASLAEVLVFDDDTLLFHQRRVYADGVRIIEEPINEPITAGRSYEVVLVFDKPMREADGGGLPGQVVDLPVANLQDVRQLEALQWDLEEGSRYPTDRVRMRLDLTHAWAEGSFQLSVAAVDAAGVGIDGDPLTVADWSPQGWIGMETGPDELVHLTLQMPEVPTMWQVK